MDLALVGTKTISNHSRGEIMNPLLRPLALEAMEEPTVRIRDVKHGGRAAEEDGEDGDRPTTTAMPVTAPSALAMSH